MYKGTIDGKRYLKMLEDHLLQNFSQLKGTRTRKSSLIWQQDNTPGHTSKEWLKNNKIKNIDMAISEPRPQYH